jgi:hypothetical protein
VENYGRARQAIDDNIDVMLRRRDTPSMTDNCGMNTDTHSKYLLLLHD